MIKSPAQVDLNFPVKCRYRQRHRHLDRKLIYYEYKHRCTITDTFTRTQYDGRKLLRRHGQSDYISYLTKQTGTSDEIEMNSNRSLKRSHFHAGAIARELVHVLSLSLFFF